MAEKTVSQFPKTLVTSGKNTVFAQRGEGPFVTAENVGKKTPFSLAF